MSASAIANNPAGRLYDFLVKALQLPSSQQANVGQQLLLLFPLANGQNDLLTFLQELNVIVGMVDEIKRLLAICDEDHLSLFLQAEQSLKGLVNIVPLGQMWTAYTGQWINQANLLALQFASVTLSRNFPEPVISSSEIDLIRIQLTELVTSISAASIHDPLKKLVLESLEAISRALAEYELRGAKGLDDALSFVIGRGVLHAEFAETAGQQNRNGSTDGADEQNWQSRFWSLMTRIAAGINAADSVKRFTLMTANPPKGLVSDVIHSLPDAISFTETQ